jgi:uncharacterized protein (TIGR03032 family)
MTAPKPFDMEYTPQFAVLLNKLNISLALSTYQAGKVVLISPVGEDKLVQLPRTFENAMGMAFDGKQLAIATGRNVQVLKETKGLASIYPQRPNTYDAMFIPRTTYHTGYLALHDMAFMDKKIVAVNTLFSCLSYIDDNQSFTPFWQPPFITELAPEDRCHLNGLAIENNEIKYVTALGKTNERQGWRENKISGGILMEYPSGKIIVEGLSMPHSPRIYNGKLYVLNSAQGTLIEVNPETGTYEIVVKLGGFARGMDIFGDYLFIGVSKLRHNSNVFRDLPIAQTSFAGIIAVYLPFKSVVGKVEYKMSVDEIYDVKVLPETVRPNILSQNMDIIRGAIAFDNNYFWGDVLAEDKVNKSAETQQPAQQPQQTKVMVQIFKNIATSDLLSKFNNIICEEFKQKINNSTSQMNLIVASINSLPIGVLVFDALKNGTSKIYSVFVSEEFRQKQIATILLKHLYEILKQNNINYIEANFNKENSEIEIIKKLFKKFPQINLILE